MKFIRKFPFLIALAVGTVVSGCSSPKAWKVEYAPARGVEHFDFTVDTVKRAHEFCAKKFGVHSKKASQAKCQERTAEYLTSRIGELSAAEERRLSFPTFAAELMSSAYGVKPVEIRLSNLRRVGGDFYAQAGHPGKPGCGLRAKPAAVTKDTPAGWYLVAVKCR